MTEVVLQSQGLAYAPPGYRDTSPGRYLKRFDVDAHRGRGEIEWTPDITEAMRFPGSVEAFAAWKTRSTVKPTRPDGRPNRPLTAYTVTIETVK